MGVVKGLLFGALLWLLWSKVGVAALVAVPLVMFFLLWWQQDSLLYMPRQGGYRVRPEHVPPLRWVKITQRQMHCRPVVPADKIANTPLMAVNIFWTRRMITKIFDKGFALFQCHAVKM